MTVEELVVASIGGVGWGAFLCGLITIFGFHAEGPGETKESSTDVSPTGGRQEADLGFDENSKVKVKEVPDADTPSLPDPKFWDLVDPIMYHARRHDFIADPGLHTDFASVPRMFVWFLPRYGRYTKAAILHDHLWKEEVNKKGTLSRRDADGIFRQAMRSLEVPFFRRWIMWTAVRWVSLFKSKDRQGWLKDAPLILLISLLALPFVLPPGILVMVSLVVFWGIECIVYPFLKLAETSKRGQGKKANPPHFPFMTG